MFNPNHASVPRRAFAWLRQHPYTVLGVILFAVLAVPFLRKTDSQWDNVYLRAAGHLLAGQDMFRLQDGYLYPPFMAWLAIPFTYVSQNAARVVWLAMNLVALVLLWRWSWTLAEGQTHQMNNKWEHLICFLGLACGLRYGLDCLQNQQTDVVIAAMLLGGCCALLRSRSLLGATCFGLAAGMKCTALLWAPYFLYKRQWKSAAWVFIVAIGVNLLPNLTSSPRGGGLWASEWVNRYLLLMTRSDHQPGVWGSAVTLNQSLSGAGYRWLMTDWTWTERGFQVVEQTGTMTPRTLKVIVYGGELLLLGWVAWMMRRPNHFAPASPQPTADRPGLEFSLVLLLMVLLSPMSSKPHFCTLLLPAFCLARQAVCRRSWLACVCLLAALVSGLLTIKDLAGTNLASWAMWHGGVAWSALFLLFGCACTLRQAAREVEVATPTMTEPSSAQAA